MKLTAFILLCACLSAAATGNSQSVTLNVKEAPLEKVFTEIRKQTGFNFLFSSKEIKEAGKVTLQVSNASIEQVLNLCFKNKPFEYSIENNTIVVKQKAAMSSAGGGGTLVTEVDKTVIDISGKVTDSEGNPLAGASVKVKGTTLGTTTNADGSFTLKGIDENAILVFSYAEHETIELKVGNRTSITVALTRTEGELKEVVINKGYYTEKQKLSTSNVSRITSKEIERQPVTNPLLALQGRVPGLFITQSTGIPGGGVSVRIQGQNSLTSGSEPLYVIDGMPYTQKLMQNLSGSFGILGTNGGSPLNFINPSNIESIEILKDADATSIYGSRAAAGAILITTKKGKTGKTKVDVNAQTGWGKVSNFLPLLNTEQYLEMRREGFKNDGLTVPNISTSPNDVNYDVNGHWSQTKYTNWQKVLIGGTAKYTDVQASISGGNANTTFLIGTGYHKETTVFPGDLSDQKGSLHISLNNVSTNKKFNTQFSASYLVDNNNLIYTDLTLNARKLSPNAPDLYNNDGTLNWARLPNGTSTWYNPLAYLNQKYNNKSRNLITNTLIGYRIAKGLILQSSFGYNNLHTDEIMILPKTAQAPETRQSYLNRGQFGKGNITSWIIEPQASFNSNIGKGTFDVLIGTTILKEDRNNQMILGYNYSSDLLLTDIRSAGSILALGTTASVYRYNALYGRLSYNYHNKYIINLTGRRDGSSRFGPENLFHNFYSVAGAWVFSNESFFQKRLSFLNFGKIRASYGTTGNDQIGDYQFLNLYNSLSVSQSYGGATALVPGPFLPNPFLQWEETKKMQFGLDLGFLEDRFLLNANYYLNRSSNQLQLYALPLIVGRAAIQRNFPAVIQNSGLELAISTTNIRSKRGNWKTSINLTVQRNKLISYPELATSTYANSYVVGQPFTISKLYHYLGVDPISGLYTFENENGNAVSSGLTDSALRVVNTSPRFYGGFENSIRFKGFELSFLLQFSKQVKRNLFFGDSPGNFFTSASGSIGTNNQPIWVLNRWQKTGDNAIVQKFSSTYPSTISTPFNNVSFYSDAGITDASYIRLKNFSLSWQLPESWKQKIHVQNARIYVQGQNLLTITKYKGMDPETGFDNLPPLRTVTVGIQITL